MKSSRRVHNPRKQNSPTPQSSPRGSKAGLWKRREECGKGKKSLSLTCCFFPRTNHGACFGVNGEAP